MVGLGVRKRYPWSFFYLETIFAHDRFPIILSPKGMSKEDAMKAYVDLLSSSDPIWETHDALKDYKP